MERDPGLAPAVATRVRGWGSLLCFRPHYPGTLVRYRRPTPDRIRSR